MKKLFCTCLLIILMVGCKEGKLEEGATPLSFNQDTLTLVDYSATDLELFLKGHILADGIEDFHEVQFYDNKQCEGVAGGVATKQDVEQSGITLSVSIQENLELYYRTNTSSKCHFALNHTVSLDPVPVPVLKRTIPEAPARTTTSIAILGQAFPNQATVELYTDSLCTTAVATGDATSFNQPGLLVTVAADTTTPIAARTKDPRGKYSACEVLIEYEHRSELSSEVAFLNTTPLSPSSTVNNPVIRGQAQSTITGVTLYSDAACSVSLGQVDSTTFATTGLEVSLPSNSTTQVYGQGLSEGGDLTACVFLTEYIHDDIAPAAPTFTSADPITPTRMTTLPKIIGTAPADAATVRLFSDSLCNQVIGFGTRSLFTSTGVTANLPANDTTSIYGQSLDASGNESACTYFLDYKHNTIAPQPPFFQTSTPTSPTNQTENPLLIGTPSQFTYEMYFYDDLNCTNLVGQGTPSDFSSTGIQVSLQVNTNNFIYSRVRDFEGNYSDCTELTNYDHSNLPAPSPSFSVAYPSSPTRLTTTPSIAGTADATITTVEMYLDSGCSTMVNSGSRGNFSAAGIPVTVNANAVTAVYARANDIYGNTSSCDLLTNYTHTNIPPLDPTFSLTSPASPNNTSFTPTIYGNAFTNMASPIDPINVVFYDNPACIGSLGNGSPSDFPTVGIDISVAPDAPSSIYARSFDAAGNGSQCTFMTNYIHNTLAPGRPILETLSPGSPSFTPLTQVTGSFGPSSDFMSRVSVTFYSDTSCTNEILTTTPNTFENVGIDVPLPANAVTPLSAASFNGVGNKSQCSQLVNFNTYDTPPTSLSVNLNANGSTQIFWQVDSVANPTASYRLKRSTQSGGPYTTIYSGPSNSYQDRQTSEGATYYYVVQATNSTGQSLNSAEVSILVDSQAPVAAASLLATPSNNQVVLTWSGFSQNLSYNVYRGTTSGGPYTTLITGHQNNSYTDFSATNNQTYYYVVKGFNPEGESTSSNEVRVVPRPIPPAPANIWVQPHNSLAECSGNRGILVQWTEPSHYNSFRLHRDDDNGNQWYQNVSQPRYVDCDMGGVGILQYDVQSVWGTYRSAASPIVQIDPGQTTLFVHPGDAHVNIKWNAPTNADTIDIYRSTQANGPFTLYSTQANSGNYLDTGVSNGQAYYYYLQARLGANIFQGFPSSIQGGVPGPAPSAPTHLLGEASGNGVQLTWSAPSHYNEFNVYRATNIGGPYLKLATSPLNNYLDFLPPSGLSYYRITAQWGTTETAVSNTFTFRKGRVINLTAAGSASDIQLDWNAFVGASSYRVQRSADNKTAWTTIGLPATNTFIDSTAVSGEGYYYRVLPIFPDATEGQYSTTASARRTDSNIPGGLSLLSQSTGSLGLTWVAVPGATLYNLMIATSPGGPYTLANSTASNLASATGLTARTSYYLRVDAIVGGTPYSSNPFQAATLNPVSPPSAAVGNGLVDLNWTSSIGVSTYDVERSTDGLNFSNIVSGLTTPSYTDSTAVNGQIYFYRVIHNYAGVGSSVSNRSAGVTPGVTPLPPQGLTISENSNGIDVSLSWTRSTEANFYGVYQATSLGGPYTQRFNTSSNTDVVVGGLTPGQTYFFRVTALNGSIESGPSSVVSVRPMATPNAPTGQFVSSTEIQLNWSSVANADTYDVLRSNDDLNFFVIATGVATTNYLDNTVDPNFTYYYRYQPVEASGERLPVSNSSDLIGTGTVINAPQGLTIAADSTPQIFLQWAPVPQAQEYEIFRSLTSGSGFSNVGTISAANTNWTDTTVVTSQTYYYQVRAVNAFSTPSNFSSEVSISLVASPTGLAASDNNADIDLTWNAVAGASQYWVYRSLESSGNFGPIGSSATTSYSDTTTVPGETYYYKVAAELSSGVLTPPSTSTSVTKSGVMDLTVPVELLDRPVSSNSMTPQIFNRSSTRFNTQEFDGSITYTFEIVASNVDIDPKSVTLVDESDATLATISIPAGTSDPTRFIQSFSPPGGAQLWRVQLEQTSFDEELLVTQARVLVNQVDATKTALYFPLLSSNLGGSMEDLAASVAQSDSPIESVLFESLPYIRQANQLQTIDPVNPWALEVVVASESGVIGEVALYNIDQDTAVESSITEFDQAQPTAIRIPMANEVTDFGSSNEDEAFAISLRCQFNCETGAQARIYKAGLWVRLVHLQKAQVSWRTSLGASLPASNTVLDLQRSFINLSDFNSTQVFWQVAMNSDQTVSLGNAGTNDAGTAGVTTVPGSSLTGGGTGFVEILRSSGLSLSSGDRYLLLSNPTFPIPLSGSQLIINNDL